AILATIMDDPKQSARHRVDSIRALDALADPGPQAATQEDRIHIVINLGADERVVVDAPINPTPPNNTIDVTPQELPPTTPRPSQPPRKPPGSFSPASPKNRHHNRRSLYPNS